MNRWLVRISLGVVLLGAVVLTASAASPTVDLSFHIPALDPDNDVASAYVQLNWSDGTHTTVTLETNTVLPTGILTASTTTTVPDKTLSSIWAYGNRLSGPAYSRSATAREVGTDKYDLLVSGVWQGIIILPDPEF